jgi:hypothetical protein
MSLFCYKIFIKKSRKYTVRKYNTSLYKVYLKQGNGVNIQHYLFQTSTQILFVSNCNNSLRMEYNFQYSIYND